MEGESGIGGGIEPHPLEFSGSGGEYFRVWLVNVLLTIVTLGFYTPFARRRTAQYFWGHTLVAGSPLEFAVQQKRMVFGFLLLLGVYAAFRIAAETGQDTASFLMLLAGAALAPYFWGSAMRFRLNATRWRGVRLQFAGRWGEVYRAAWPLYVAALCWAAALAVVDLLAPESDDVPMRGPDTFVAVCVLLLAVGVTIACAMRLEFNAKSLMVARGRIGGQAGRWKPVYRDFVRIWLATVGVFLLTALLFVGAVALVVGGSAAFLSSPRAPGAGAVFAIFLMVLAALFGLVLASAPARAYREARMFQLVWNNIGVSHIARFRCDLGAWRFVRLRILNLVLTLCTFGLYRPFARISEYRMKTESVTLHVKGGLDQLVGQLSREEQGLGDALADAVGLDLVG